LTAFVQKGKQGEGKPTKPGVPFVEPGFAFVHSVYTDIVPSNHFTSCAPGESYEMELPKGANMKPPRGYYTPLEACFFNPQNTHSI